MIRIEKTDHAAAELRVDKAALCQLMVDVDSLITKKSDCLCLPASFGPEARKWFAGAELLVRPASDSYLEAGPSGECSLYLDADDLEHLAEQLAGAASAATQMQP